MSRPLPPPRFSGGARGLHQGGVATDHAARHGAEGGVPQVGCGVVIEFGEARRDPGLQREAAQDAATERMDCFDAQAAGCLERFRKQLAGAAYIFLAIAFERPAFEVAQFLLELRCIHHAPAAETFEQAGLHLAGGGLGVGDAQDRIRFDTAQQQACNAVDQDFRLAGTSIGFNPGG